MGKAISPVMNHLFYSILSLILFCQMHKHAHKNVFECTAQTCTSNVPEYITLSSGVDHPIQEGRYPDHPDSRQVQKLVCLV